MPWSDEASDARGQGAFVCDWLTAPREGFCLARPWLLVYT